MWLFQYHAHSTRQGIARMQASQQQNVLHKPGLGMPQEWYCRNETLVHVHKYFPPERWRQLVDRDVISHVELQERHA